MMVKVHQVFLKLPRRVSQFHDFARKVRIIATSAHVQSVWISLSDQNLPAPSWQTPWERRSLKATENARARGERLWTPTKQLSSGPDTSILWPWATIQVRNAQGCPNQVGIMRIQIGAKQLFRRIWPRDLYCDVYKIQTSALIAWSIQKSVLNMHLHSRCSSWEFHFPLQQVTPKESKLV